MTHDKAIGIRYASHYLYHQPKLHSLGSPLAVSRLEPCTLGLLIISLLLLIKSLHDTQVDHLRGEDLEAAGLHGSWAMIDVELSNAGCADVHGHYEHRMGALMPDGLQALLRGKRLNELFMENMYLRRP